MRLKVGEFVLLAEERERREQASPHTGQPVSAVDVQVRVPIDSNDSILAALQKDPSTEVEEVDDDGRTIRKWTIRLTSWSHTAGARTAFHAWALEQVEPLALEVLWIDELALSPYAYKEDVSDGALVIDARVLVNDEQYKSLRRMMMRGGYFSVRRVGISPDVRQMRFGQMKWSKHQDEIKHEIFLVDQSLDEQPRTPSLFDPELPNMQRVLATEKSRLDVLIDLLLEKGQLLPSDLDAIRTRSKDMIFDARREFYLVDDLDAEPV